MKEKQVLEKKNMAVIERVYRRLKDHMTYLELIFSMLGEASTDEIERT